MTQETRSDTAALLGWHATPMGERIVLCMECTDRRPPISKGDVQSRYLMLTRQQAVQLGQYLFTVAGATAPERKKPLLDKLFGA
jgi:hypothetical protein